MTVYVDDMRAAFRGHIMCHMIADTEDELHEMAARIGIERRWRPLLQRHRVAQYLRQLWRDASSDDGIDDY